MVEILTNNDLIKESFVARSKDNLFTNEHVKHSLEEVHHQMDGTNDMPTYEHNVDSMNSNEVGLNLEVNVRNEKPFDDEALPKGDDEQDDDDYNDLILSPNHF